MKIKLLIVTVAFVSLMTGLPVHAGQFLLDFAGTGPNSSGTAAGWDGINDLPLDVAVALTDRSGSGDDDVVITAIDDSFSPNNTAPPGVGTVIDGITVPAEAVDDYLFKTVDTAGTSARLRIDNLDPGFYNVSVFEGRTTDPSQFAVLWLGDDTGSGEPAMENTGNFAQGSSTLSFTVNAGDTLWYRHLEDNTGGLSGIMINPVPEPASATLLGFGGLFVLSLIRRRRS